MGDRTSSTGRPSARRYSPELKERAVRMVFETFEAGRGGAVRDDYPDCAAAGHRAGVAADLGAAGPG
jgi:hypothetical protein